MSDTNNLPPHKKIDKNKTWKIAEEIQKLDTNNELNDKISAFLAAFVDADDIPRADIRLQEIQAISELKGKTAIIKELIEPGWTGHSRHTSDVGEEIEYIEISTLKEHLSVLNQQLKKLEGQQNSQSVDNDEVDVNGLEGKK